MQLVGAQGHRPGARRFVLIGPILPEAGGVPDSWREQPLGETMHQAGIDGDRRDRECLPCTGVKTLLSAIFEQNKDAMLWAGVGVCRTPAK